MRLAETIGKVKKPINKRQEELSKKFNIEAEGVMHVTKGALFGHKEVLDWHANKPSDKDRASLVWIYAKRGSEGSITSWIDNKKLMKTYLKILKRSVNMLNLLVVLRKVVTQTTQHLTNTTIKM